MLVHPPAFLSRVERYPCSPPEFCGTLQPLFFGPKCANTWSDFSAEGWELATVCPFKPAKKASQILEHMVSIQAMCRLCIGMHTSQPWTPVQVLATPRSFEHDNMRSRAKTFQEKMSYLSRTFLTEWDFASSICPFCSGWKESQTTPGIALYRQLIWLNSQKLHPKTCHFQTTEVQKSKFSMFTLGRHVHSMLWNCWIPIHPTNKGGSSQLTNQESLFLTTSKCSEIPFQIIENIRLFRTCRGAACPAMLHSLSRAAIEHAETRGLVVVSGARASGARV